MKMWMNLRTLTRKTEREIKPIYVASLMMEASEMIDAGDVLGGPTSGAAQDIIAEEQY